MAFHFSPRERRAGIGAIHASIKALVNITKRGSRPEHAKRAWADAAAKRAAFLERYDITE